MGHFMRNWMLGYICIIICILLYWPVVGLIDRGREVDGSDYSFLEGQLQHGSETMIQMIREGFEDRKITNKEFRKIFKYYGEEQALREELESKNEFIKRIDNDEK